jgi:predicted O-methyltransferase YrrM
MLRRIVGREMERFRFVHVRWVRRDRDAWLAGFLRAPIHRVPELSGVAAIETRAATTQALGARPLWHGYGESPGSERSSNQVRTAGLMGSLYASLVRERRPNSVVEFGTAFGVSGMYWLLGLELAQSGHLWTFEPNDAWTTVARQNLAAVSSRFTAVTGTFEDNVDGVLTNNRIDVAFIDAIHSSEYVHPQYARVYDRLSPGGIVVLDDINFSEDMAACWRELATSPVVRSSATLGRRVGILEHHASLDDERHDSR